MHAHHSYAALAGDVLNARLGCSVRSEIAVGR
jgi:hypothetical protein